MKDGGPAFPSGAQMTLNADGNWPAMIPPQNGMSLRQLYAGMAMQGLLTRNEVVPRYCGEWSQERASEICADAYTLADAMIKEGEK